MNSLPAYAVYRNFAAEKTKEAAFDRHYLLYAAKGAMRLEAEGRRWSLPPARAAWIRADAPIRVTIDHGITCCSVLFSPDVYAGPSAVLTVLEMTPLARALILECGAFGPETEVLEGYPRRLFDMLHATADELALRPSFAWMPQGRSDAVRRAMALTEDRLDEDLRFDEIASAAALSQRSLARRFAGEMGMTWRQAQRRLRMIRALEMLALDNRQITEIALSVGYSSLSAFNAGFREFSNMTPSEYRATLGSPPG